MSTLEVKRWVRYGHHRLYVQTANGERHGYWDCRAGVAVVEPGIDRPAFDAALAPHLPGGRPATVVPTGAHLAERSPAPTPDDVTVASDAAPVEAHNGQDDPVDGVEPAEPQWTDLSTIRPGAAAREQAVALKQAAPVRTILARVFGVRTDERAWWIGADGEEAVAARLARLGNRWKVLHAVPVGENGSDIDHVVVGPAGVFTVNDKHHPDAPSGSAATHSW